MFFLGITDGSGNEVGQPSQPVILPRVEWQNFDAAVRKLSRLSMAAAGKAASAALGRCSR